MAARATCVEDGMNVSAEVEFSTGESGSLCKCRTARKQMENGHQPRHTVRSVYRAEVLLEEGRHGFIHVLLVLARHPVRSLWVYQGLEVLARVL